MGPKKSLSSPWLEVTAQDMAQYTDDQSRVWHHSAIQAPQILGKINRHNELLHNKVITSLYALLDLESLVNINAFLSKVFYLMPVTAPTLLIISLCTRQEGESKQRDISGPYKSGRAN